MKTKFSGLENLEVTVKPVRGHCPILSWAPEASEQSDIMEVTLEREEEGTKPPYAYLC